MADGRSGVERAAAEPAVLARRLTVAGVLGAVVLVLAFAYATFNGVHMVDAASIAAEEARATAAVSALRRDGVPDADIPMRLAGDYALAGARIAEAGSVAPGELTLQLDAATELAWTPRRLGTETFAAVAPFRLAVTGGVVAALLLVIYRLYATSRDLDRRRAEARGLAARDPLTGLGNRLAFDEGIADALHELAAGSAPFALLYLDLDHFKSVNDTLGHAAGDRLLVEVGRRLSDAAGPGDRIARLGGDEFAVIRRGGASLGALQGFASGLQDHLSRPYALGSAQLTIGVSIGVAMAPDHGGSPAELLAAADAALYRAKAAGQAQPAFAQRRRNALAERRAA